MKQGSLVWFRRDLRDRDHAALAAALARRGPVHGAFVFDPELLEPLPRDDRRVAFIHAALVELDAALRTRGGGLHVLQGDPRHKIPQLVARLGVAQVHANRDYEPAAIARDAEVAAACRLASAEFLAHDDLMLREPAALSTRAGTPYTIFTPYRRAWLAALGDADLAERPSHGGALAADAACGVPGLETLGFSAPAAALDVPTGRSGGLQLLEGFARRIEDYHAARDFPAQAGTSRLSPHLRFGTLSTREVMRAAIAHGALRGAPGAETWLGEMIWREFFRMILARFPHVVTHSFQPRFDALRWEQGPAADDALVRWQAGQTGYPLVDAGMRELAATGLMHNRLRMVTASFLCKDLGLDWRQGEAWFARHLLDFDLSANNGGWQWSASTGCDAQPWFRVFNPVTQSQRFDPAGAYIRRWVPELANLPPRHIHAPWLMSTAEQSACGVGIGRDYPAPVVDHAVARERTLARYRALNAVPA